MCFVRFFILPVNTIFIFFAKFSINNSEIDSFFFFIAKKNFIELLFFVDDRLSLHFLRHLFSLMNYAFVNFFLDYFSRHIDKSVTEGSIK